MNIGSKGYLFSMKKHRKRNSNKKKICNNKPQKNLSMISSTKTLHKSILKVYLKQKFFRAISCDAKPVSPAPLPLQFAPKLKNDQNLAMSFSTSLGVKSFNSSISSAASSR